MEFLMVQSLITVVYVLVMVLHAILYVVKIETVVLVPKQKVAHGVQPVLFVNKLVISSPRTVLMVNGLLIVMLVDSLRI